MNQSGDDHLTIKIYQINLMLIIQNRATTGY